jgi:hypothetical protein
MMRSPDEPNIPAAQIRAMNRRRIASARGNYS